MTKVNEKNGIARVCLDVLKRFYRDYGLDMPKADTYIESKPDVMRKGVYTVKLQKGTLEAAFTITPEGNGTLNLKSIKDSGIGFYCLDC